MEITEATTINIGLLIAVGGIALTIFGLFTKWLTAIWRNTTGNTDKIIHIEEDLGDIKKTMAETHIKMKDIQSKQSEQLARIEENVKAMTKVLDSLNTGVLTMVRSVVDKLDIKK